MLEVTEKKTNLISYESLLKRAYHVIKVCLISIAAIELICLMLGLILGHDLLTFFLVGLAPSSIIMILACRDIIKVICIKCGFISIRNDEITKTWIMTRGGDNIYFANLEKNGKISLSESEYKEMKQGDKMYVVKYGPRLLKETYPQSCTQIDQELRIFYEE